MKPNNITGVDFVIISLPFSVLLTRSSSFCCVPDFPACKHHRLICQSDVIFWYLYIPAHVCISILRQANTYSKFFLELGIVVGAQILYVLQKCLLVDRPDRREEQH